VIHEVIVTTRNADGGAQIAPMGIRWHGELAVIAPFRPSTTLDNLLARRSAVINYSDDVRVFAGCLTGRYQWPLVAAERVDAPRLAEALAHAEVEVERLEDDPVRPRLLCRRLFEATHGPFRGFNRAQAAVLELAILASRLDRLPPEKITREMRYLSSAVEKTAGAREREAWGWLAERIDAWREGRGRGG
jgi:hypothetical protein